MLKKFKGLLLAFAAIALVANASLPAFAQNPTGSIRGVVKDPQGAIVTNANITVRNKATGDKRQANTGNDGIYSVQNLLPGEYEITVEAQNFATSTLNTVVEVGTTTTGDVTLTVGAPKEVVDVVAGANATLDKENHQIAGVIQRQKIDALPLNGRNFLQLALLEPGVSVSTKSPGSQNNLFNVSIGGGDSALTRLTVDGGSIVDPVCGGAAQNFSTETVQEFQISTYNFDLSTGITSVGAINIVSRTGTNEYHGNAFLYFRDHSIAALPTFFRPSKDFDPFFRRYQYGGSIGGPIKKDKILFFGNAERLDQNAAVSSVITGTTQIAPGLPSLSQFNTVTNSPYKGILVNVRGDIKINNSQSLFTRYSYDTNDVFAPDADNTLPSNWRENSNNDHNAQVGLTSLISQNVVNDVRFNYQKIKNVEGIPTATDCPPSNVGCIGLGGPQIRIASTNFRAGNTVNAPQERNLDRYQTTDNLNWQKGAHRLRFGGEWEHNYGKGLWAFLDPALVVVHNPQTLVGVNSLVAGTINGIPNAVLPPQQKALIIAALNIPVPSAFLTPGAQITLNDLLNLSLVAGNTSGVTIPLTGIGNPQQPQPFNEDIARQSNRYRFYAQDSWLVRPGFTFSYGASYQLETNLQNHDLAKPALLEPILGKLGKPGKDTNNIAPSVGFAWDVGNKGKTVIRGGAGFYYDTILFVTRLRERAAIGPAGNGRAQIPGSFFRNTVQFPQLGLPGPLAPLNIINPAIGAPIFFGLFPTKYTAQNFLNTLSVQSPQILDGLGALGAAGFTGVDVFKTATDLLDPNLQIPYSEQFTIGVQRQLPKNMVLSADFVMRKSLHELMQNDFNLFNRVASRGGPVIPACSLAQQGNPAAQCSNGPISVIQSSGRSQYKALLVKLDKRFSNRYQFTVSYALSSLTGFFTNEDDTDYFRYHGNLDADARHRLTVSGVVNLPYGFQTSLIAVYASRAPFNARISDTLDLNGDGTTGDTLPGLKINSLNRGTSKNTLIQLVNQFNATFAGKQDANGNIIGPIVLPTKFEFGDDFQSEDIRLTKTFKITERMSVQGFAEVFNVFNISNLGGYSDTLNSGFGQPSTRAGQNFGTGGPRAFQFGGRFSF